MGIFSLVIGLTLCLGGASILNILVLNKRFATNFFNYKYLFMCALSAVPVALISKWIFGIVILFLPMFFSLFLACFVGLSFFFVFAVVFNLISLSMLKQKIKLKK